MRKYANKYGITLLCATAKHANEFETDCAWFCWLDYSSNSVSSTCDLNLSSDPHMKIAIWIESTDFPFQWEKKSFSKVNARLLNYQSKSDSIMVKSLHYLFLWFIGFSQQAKKSNVWENLMKSQHFLSCRCRFIQ